MPDRQINAPIEEEMRKSYLDYAMSVIVGRALPDIRDGLKPVHRRVLYTMQLLGLASNRGYKKAARVVGDCMGKFHPHGDSAIYDALVRMVQEFSLRYPLVDGQGNFGSIDGDPAAAMHRLETVADVRQGASHDDGHRVIEIRLPHLLFDGDGHLSFVWHLPSHVVDVVPGSVISSSAGSSST